MTQPMPLKEVFWKLDAVAGSPVVDQEVSTAARDAVQVLRHLANELGVDPEGGAGAIRDALTHLKAMLEQARSEHAYYQTPDAP